MYNVVLWLTGPMAGRTTRAATADFAARAARLRDAGRSQRLLRHAEQAPELRVVADCLVRCSAAAGACSTFSNSSACFFFFEFLGQSAGGHLVVAGILRIVRAPSLEELLEAVVGALD
eukprot:TRINITY_DN48335_c0_g1_i1.p3 TRINITY_DN48335_c0_g1~~TRINITY_DN48335_c0_g1_i1.p3  ORF type:complete len:118 (-),score=14.98 TRINITY_DN48335_c0_g1_i1:194-547(-)